MYTQAMDTMAREGGARLEKVLGPEEQERNDQDYENFTSAKTEHGVPY